ncbi:LacI family DNA-binding transcriptional regulator [Dyella solisilvae]|uniref:LacI family DNA-binding transcriptional regulator n=1 Tax=Dyella solisilvae TaxID=1920168 RepID=A0A370K8F1_9GAMM|nr:LacI family DNA-binding transcriptional regulator [Dyella solisilvae]RDI98914.1 LacI family DNA-binding transcriptional regulator [Dyella solisilvae]
MKNTVRKSVRRKGAAITIDDVAVLAKVSPMTVSRVMNGHSKVRDATRERVMEAVRELGYIPNLAASSLAAAQDARIALIYTNPSGGYLRELLLGALRGAARTAAQLVIDNWDELDVGAERVAARALANSVAGVILPPPLCESKVVIEELVNAGVPVVAIAAGRFNHDISSVRIDDFIASKEVTEHLLRMGHKRIAFIKGHPNQTASTRRYEGYQAALKDAGIPLDPALVQQGYFTYRSGLDTVERLLSLRQPPTAIFASNDDMAAAAISVAHRRGLDVPRDLSIMGFDDTSAATTVWPELSTVRQPIASMADSAIDILLRSIRRKDNDTKVVVDHVVAHQLIKRDSVAPPVARKTRG